MKQLIFLVCYFTICTCWAQKNMPCVKVIGDVSTPLTLYERDIAGMKRSVVHFKEQNEIEYFYAGVSIQEILRQAGAQKIVQPHGRELDWYILVRGADGFETILSAAEIDSTFTGKTIILADRINDKPLPKGLGPFRLIVPGEENRVRWLWEITTLIVKRAEE